MIPVLFKGNETNFNHNGIGLLKDTLSCEVSEVRNGSFDLELVYPITGSYFKDLKNGNIIQAKPNDTDQPHNFRITEIDKTLSDKEVVVYGVSTTNDLGGNMVKSLYLEDLTPQVILNEMKNALHYPTTFNFVSNITTIGSVNWELNNPLNLIVGEEGSLVDIFGGEVKRTNDTVYLYGRRGKDNVTTIRAGKNLDGFKMTESFQGKYTQILPYFKYEAEVSGGTEGETIRQEVTVFGSIVSSPYHGRYPVNAIKPIDFSQNELVRESKSLDSLNSVASKYFSNLYSEIDKPSVSINVDMIQLVDSEQYALYEKLEKIELTDTVSVYVSEYDVDVLVKITELKYDSLRERTISIVASSSSSGRTSLMDEISGSYKQFTTTLVDDKIQSATSGIINQILTQKNGSNMYAGRATPPENSKPGDIWFKDTGGGDVELYEFDGVNWVRKMYKGFGDDVRQLVDDKIAESNALFTGALEEQEAAVEQANALAQLAKTTATNASLSASAANQDAQKALADAANAKTEALAQFSMVSQALDTAKTNLQNQVSAADSKAVKAQADVDGLKVKADTIKNDLDTAKTNLQNQVSAADSKAVKAQADANALRTDLNKQAQTISAQAQAQTALTNRVTTVETLADGTKTTVVELSKTVDKATGDITSVTNRTKVVEDGLAGVKTNYTQLSQTVNTQTGQIQTINSKTADLQSGIDGVNQRFENLRIGATNYIIDFGFANINQFKSIISLWTFERISDSTARSGYHIKATCTKAGTHGFIRLLRDLRGTEWQGRKMTYSIDIKASKSVRMKLGVEAFFKGIKDFDVTTDWQRFISTADVNFKNFYNFPFYRTGTETWDVGDVIYLRDPQLEDGTVATTPRAAEEDLRSEIAEYKRTADKNYAGLQSTVTTLDDKVTQNKTEVNQTATQLSNRLTSVEAYKDGESTRSQAYFEASKTETARQITAERTAISANYVAKSTYDENVSGTTLKLNEVKTNADTTKQNLATYQDTVNRKLTELTTSDQTLDNKISSIKTTITQTSQGVEQLTTSLATTDGKVTTAETKINQLMGEVSSKVSQTDYNTLTGRMSTAESSIMQVPNKIALAVEQVTAKIPTSAGNKNYLGVSKVVNRLSNNFAYNESTGIWSMTVPSNMGLFGIGVYFDTRGNTVMLNGGETLFIGLTVMVNKAVQFTFDINNRLHVNHVSGNDHDDRAKSVIFPSNSMLEPNVWTRVYLMYTAKPGVPIWDTNTNFGLLNRTEDVQLQIKEVTMAKSNIPVDYQKAESDIDLSISDLKTSITQQADQIALKANQTELNNLTGRMSTAEGKITTQAGLIELKAAKTDLTPITNSLNTKVDINQVNSAITAGTQGISQEVSAVKGVLEGGISARNYAVGTSTPSVHAVDSRTSTVYHGFVVNTLYSTHENKTLKELGFTVGDKYTVIFDIYAENNTAFRDYRVEGYNYGYLHIVGSITNSIGTTTTPTQFVGTATISSEDHLNVFKWVIRFDLSFMNITVKNFRIFKGEIKQDWYPAWEDQEAALEATKSRVDITEKSITSLVTGAKTLPDGRTSVFATKIESLEGAITQRVTTQELNNKGYQTATDVTNRLAGYVTNQTYTTYTTARQQTDQQIIEQINQTVSKVPTGPVNLIVNGFDPQTISPWKLLDTTNWTLELTTHGFFYNGTKKLMRFKTSTVTTKGTFESNVFNLKRNTKYTIRVGIFANSNCKDLRFCFGRGTSTSISDYIMAHEWFVGSQTKLEYKTITVDSGNYDYGKLTFDHNGTKTVGSWADMYIAEISIIEGEYNNSWTPSFDELITEQKFNETKSTVDAFSRAIGTRDETGFVPNIARLVMTQDAVISEVAKYGEHNNNLVQDSVRFSTTIDMNGSSPTIIEDGNITWRKFGSTTYTWAGIGIPVNVKRFIAGEKYTLSFEYYLYQSPDADIYVEIKDHTNNRGYCYGFIANTSTPINTYHYFQQTFTIDAGTASNTIVEYLYFYLIKNGDIGIRNVMLVRGEKIGPYSTSQVDSVTSRVEQTANSYSVKFLNNANDITTQLNLTSSGARIKSSLIHLDGNVTVSGTAWMDGAIIKNLSADKITTGTLNANNVNITNLSVNSVSGITATYLQSVIGTAFIDWMKGKVIQGYNNNMTIDLLGGNITLNSGSNSIKRIKGTHTAFVHFNDVNGSYDGNVGSLYAAIGVTSSGDGVNSMSSGRFAGLRAFRAASGTEHNATIDQTEIYGDKIIFKDDFSLARGFQIRAANLDKSYDLNDDILNPIRFFARLLLHLNNTGWNWRDGAFLDILLNEWNYYGLYRYGGWDNGKFNKP